MLHKIEELLNIRPDLIHSGRCNTKLKDMRIFFGHRQLKVQKLIFYRYVSFRATSYFIVAPVKIFHVENFLLTLAVACDVT